MAHDHRVEWEMWIAGCGMEARERARWPQGLRRGWRRVGEALGAANLHGVQQVGPPPFSAKRMGDTPAAFGANPVAGNLGGPENEVAAGQATPSK